jgi:uncharacterized DUF497 family protein
MPYYFFIWDDDNERHIREHGVTMDEFEEVVCEPGSTGESRATGRPIAFGYTSTGKYLACVYDWFDESTVYPITAYDVGE